MGALTHVVELCKFNTGTEATVLNRKHKPMHEVKCTLPQQNQQAQPLFVAHGPYVFCMDCHLPIFSVVADSNRARVVKVDCLQLVFTLSAPAQVRALCKDRASVIMTTTIIIIMPTG